MSGQLHAPVVLPPANGPPIPIKQEPGLAPEPVWMLWTREKFCLCRGSYINTLVVQCSHYFIDRAILTSKN
jgi:hypothetical protein